MCAPLFLLEVSSDLELFQVTENVLLMVAVAHVIIFFFFTHYVKNGWSDITESSRPLNKFRPDTFRLY